MTRALRCLPVTLTVLLTASALSAPVGVASASQACTALPKHAQLNGVSATSESDAWAVGWFSPGTPGEVASSLIEHWDGTHWCEVPSPDPSTYSNVLYAVSARSADDAWAVGTYNASNGGIDTLIEHWDGTSWSQVPSPDPSVPYLINYLFGIAAQSPKSVWAVGNYAVSTGQSTLILHWDGSSWSQVTGPNPLQYNYLQAVATYKSSTWAVGNSNEQTFTVQRQGSNWIQSASPIVPRLAFLPGLAMASGRDGWAVGFDNTFQVQESLILHWNGSAWSKVASPRPAVDGNLNSVAATSATNAWAVGSHINRTYSPPQPTMILHWNGKAWREVTSPSPHGKGATDILNGVAATSRSDAWAVGTWATSRNSGAMILHWNGKSWTVAAIA